MSEQPAEQPIDAAESTPTPPGAAIAQAPTPQRCVLGSVIAAVLAYALYNMTSAIAQSFALHPVTSDNLIVQRISAAVRTLVIGMTTLGMGVFTLAAIGLFALAIQILLKPRNATPPSNPS